MARIVVSSTMVRFPLGGMAHADVPWLVGLKQLGHDVYLVEKATKPQACYDVSRRETTDDCSYGVAFVNAFLARYGLEDRWCFVDWNGTYHGLSRDRIREVFRTVDVLLECNWNDWLPMADAARARVFIDSEPGWYHMLLEKKARKGELLPAYDAYYTDGQNIGTAQCASPTLDKTWGKFFWPILVDSIPTQAPPRDGAFSTVMQWKSNKRMKFDGVTYGQKNIEFPKFLTLPQLTSVPLEMAVSGNVPPDTREQLIDVGWRLRDADAVAATVDSYRQYILASRGEFGVCKNVFVATNCGVFPERPGNYMATGRPAVVQDTGFSDHLPCGRGLFAVRTVEDAAAALEAIASDYTTHARAAREIAVEYFDARKVLTKLLGELGVS